MEKIINKMNSFFLVLGQSRQSIRKNMRESKNWPKIYQQKEKQTTNHINNLIKSNRASFILYIGSHELIHAKKKKQKKGNQKFSLLIFRISPKAAAFFILIINLWASDFESFSLKFFSFIFKNGRVIDSKSFFNSFFIRNP